MALPKPYKIHYELYKDRILNRLNDFKYVPELDYFYELCFCICTPQSSAKNASKVVEILSNRNFQEKQFDPEDILRNPKHYIRFHITKSQRLLDVNNYFPGLITILKSAKSPQEKRMWIVENIKGFGMKEASHFLRNIGYTGLAILDRHILKNLTICGVFDLVPKISGINKYIELENDFIAFSKSVKIPIDELDLLFWSFETGEILK